MRQRTAGMEKYHSSLQLGWPEVSRRLGEGRVRKIPKAKLRVGDDKSPLYWILGGGGYRLRTGD